MNRASCYRRQLIQRSALALTFCAFLSGGCQSNAAAGDSAVIVNPTPEMIRELEKTISISLYGVPVTLGTTAFTQASVLTVEPRNRQSPKGKMASGRTMSRPEQFRLIARGDECLLEKLSTGERFVLTVTRCQAANPDSGS